jgi:mRNA-degrading endonuclease toxin of MazEF toxin-antitoxin module
MDGVALVFHIRTLDQARLIRKMGHLDTQTMTRVDAALALHLGLPLS